MSHVILNQANPFTVLGPEFFGFLLPWIFTFAIVYGLIVKANIFGGETKKIAAALSLVAAFFVTAMGGPQLAAFFTSLFGGASIFLAGILVIILFIGMISDKPFEKLNSWIVVGFVALIGVFLFLTSTGTILGISIDNQTATLIFWGIILLAVVWYIMKPEGEKGAAPPAGQRPT